MKIDVSKYLGEKYNRLTILKEVEKGIHGDTRVLCQCSCKNKTKKIFTLYVVRNGKSKSCGCLRIEKIKQRKDVIGEKYGALSIISDLETDKNGRYVLCQCDCGSKKETKLSSLRNGTSSSCGCLQKKNEIGKKYGNLTIIADVDDRKGARYVLCRCDCDEKTEKIINLGAIKRGDTIACGCLRKECAKEKQPNAIKNLIKIRTYSKEDWEREHPWFVKIEKVRNNINGFGIEVRCKHNECRKWFSPDRKHIYARIKAIEMPKGFEESNFYCSDKCKNSCILFNLKSDPFKFPINTPLQTELKIWRDEVFKRQLEEYGRNFCEYCDGEERLQAHHIVPQKINPFLAIDPDNGMVACKKCHLNIAHEDECSTGQLAKLNCE